MTAQPTGAAAVALGLGQVGVPYSWGGESPGQAFDCSGLVQWVYGQVGVQLPRTSQAQAQATTAVSAANLRPGDLVFSAGSDGTAAAPGHVGIYVGSGQYLDAPYTGAKVRLDAIPAGATFGRVPGVAVSSSTSGGGGSGGGTDWVTSAANAVTGGLYGDVTGAVSSADAVGSFLGKITSVSFWTRIGMGALGLALVGVGFVVFFEGTDTGTKITSDAVSAADIAAVA